MDWKITLCEPDIDQQELDAVTEIIKSKWFTMGGVSKKFEQEFASKTNARFAFAVTNCTAALHIANMALDIKAGDEVICPALTFVATANATRYTGADVCFADSVSQTDLTIDPDDIRKKITSKTKAISVVHYAGFSVNMEAVMEIAKEYNLKIIEDCAHSPLAEYRYNNGERKHLGTIGDIGCFSFFSNKNMTTGEGGMITTNDEELARKITLLRSHGMTSLTYDRHKGHSSGYDVVALGYNYRIDEIRSAIGLVQLGKVEKNNAVRRTLFRKYIEIMKDNANLILPFAQADIDCATPHIMSVMVKENYQEIRNRLFEAKIQTSRHYDLIPNFTLYQNDPFESKIEYIDHLMTLPLYPDMTEDDIRFIDKIIRG